MGTMSCEMCGREGRGLREAIIDGAKMRVCADCFKYSEGYVEEPVKVPPTRPQRPLTPKSRPSAPKDIYKNMEKELVSNWSKIIEEARRKKGLTREELGFKIGERTVTIAKIENGDLRPSDQMITKLEKELGISLLEEVKAVSATQQSHTQDGYTLGDFIKQEK